MRMTATLGLLFACWLSVGGAHAARRRTGGQATDQQRKTSEPYTGDLSIFESAGREERLQINRVMDLLASAPGRALQTLGRGRDGLRYERRSEWDGGTVYAVDINPDASALYTRIERSQREAGERQRRS